MSSNQESFNITFDKERKLKSVRALAFIPKLFRRGVLKCDTAKKL